MCWRSLKAGCRLDDLGAEHETTGTVVVEFLEAVVWRHWNLGEAHKEIAILVHFPGYLLKDFTLGIRLEINEDVSHEDDVHAWQWRPRLHQV